MNVLHADGSSFFSVVHLFLHSTSILILSLSLPFSSTCIYCHLLLSLSLSPLSMLESRICIAARADTTREKTRSTEREKRRVRLVPRSQTVEVDTFKIQLQNSSSSSKPKVVVVVVVRGPSSGRPRSALHHIDRVQGEWQSPRLKCCPHHRFNQLWQRRRCPRHGKAAKSDAFD